MKKEQPVDILVVDDSEESLHVLVSIIEEEGYDARPVTSGIHAVKAAHLSPPQLILLDIGLPDIDGYQVCAQLKADDRTRDIPILFISGLHATADKVRALTSGGVDYVTKPFQIEEVKARIRTHLSIRDMQEDLQRQNSRLRNEIVRRETAEKALQKANDELEERVNERTEELRRTNELLRNEVALRTEAEKRLEELFELSSTIVQHIPSGLFVFQYQAPKELFLVNANLEARRLTGISAEEWRGQEVDEVWPDARRQGLSHAFLKTMETGETFRARDVVFWKGGVQRRVALCAFRMLGDLLGVSFQDFAELRVAEAHISGAAAEKGDMSSAPSFEEETLDHRQHNLHPPGLRILLLVDSDMQSKILEKALGKSGHTASIVPSLHEALESLSQDPVSVIICDLDRAEGNPQQLLETVEEFCEVNGLQPPPLVYLAESGKAGGFTNLGKSTVAQKPVHIMRLLEIIREAVDSGAPQKS